MKKVLLALSVVYGTGAFAQSALTPADINAHPTTTEEQAVIDQAKNRFHQANAKKAKAAGGVVSQYMSHVDVAENFFGAALDNFISPIFQDSVVLQDFGTPENVDNHGYSGMFDVYSQAFTFDGLDYFHRNDAYTVDSVLIGGFYDVVNNKTAPFTGDTLIVDIVYGAPTATAMWRQLTWPAGTWSNQTNPYPFPAVAFTGNPAHGFAGDVTWSNKVTLKKALTPNDTANGYHSFYTNLSIPAGSIVGTTVRFKSGETYNPGDIYFAGSGSTTTADLNSFRVLITGPAGAGDDNAYFFEEVALGVPESYAGSGPLFSSSRYGTVTNGYFLNQGAISADWWLHVSGTSTIGLDEEKVNNNVALYPNPTTGNVSIAISQGGTYNLEVVNMLGQVVHAEEVTVSGNEELKRDLSHLTKGIYLVNIKGDNYSNTSKLTINK